MPPMTSITHRVLIYSKALTALLVQRKGGFVLYSTNYNKTKTMILLGVYPIHKF